MNISIDHSIAQALAVAFSATLSVVIFIIFKLIGKRNLYLPAIIVWNYIVCVIVGGLLLSFEGFYSRGSLYQPGLFQIISLGLLFMVTFLLMGRATAKSGAAVSAISSKMSVVIPIAIAMFVWLEPYTLNTIIGVVLAMLAVFMISYQKESSQQFDISLLGVFLGSGFVDAGMGFIKHANYTGWSNLAFAVLTFTGAAISGLVYLIATKQLVALFKLKEGIVGLILGVVNLFSIFAIYQALDFFQNKSAVFFMLNNVSVVVGTFLVGLFFKERFTLRSLVGLSLAILAIFLLGEFIVL